jgi:hypothetical protein
LGFDCRESCGRGQQREGEAHYGGLEMTQG